MRVLGAPAGDMVASRAEVSQNPHSLYYSRLRQRAGSFESLMFAYAITALFQ